MKKNILEEKFINKDECYNNTLVCEDSVKLILECNGRDFYKILIDTKDINKLENKQSRCDYLVATTDLKDIIIYTELKGGDLKTAYEQILAIYELLNEDFEKRYIAIVHTGNPKASTIKQKYEKKLKKSNFELPPLTSSKIITLKYNPNTKTISK
ncbi:hypothetical protein A7X81_03700 [Campylobacter ornithocola]|uniref:Uncharacterized protein n=1 Tax=Campylobacter ornithocola TaxID=1848766 RepID=A0A6M8MXV2_9BACT|nr:hypothetical protein [Campylobacter ornithocola]MCR8685970.1 hypothetical protein [Campylobacter sp. 1569]OCX42304.1 hypothetical protein A7X81_03700 [Campylobacter ornithocola]QKF57167.1 hypothetical protein CORN_0636 [Campylobacter ornithocola]